jgi:uncharacterized protein YidB (DUF937 family)
MARLDDSRNRESSAPLVEGAANPIVSQLTQFMEAEGGLTAVLESFRDKGFGPIVSSWIAKGPNLPVDVRQLQQMLGRERVQQMSAKLGLPTDLVSGAMAMVLPQLIDRMTPNGTVPPG